MTRHKMHCPQKYAIVFHSLLSHYTQHTHRHTRSTLPVPIVITPAAQLETTAAHSVKRNKQFSTILISARFDSISVSISIRLRLQIRFFFHSFQFVGMSCWDLSLFFRFFMHYFNKLYSILSLRAVVIKCAETKGRSGSGLYWVQLLMFYCEIICLLSRLLFA